MIYAVSAALVMALARRLVADVPRRFALALALLPLVFTGKAMLLGELYGPSDLYTTAEPWRRLPGPPVANPILSDLAFANLPWRAAVREALVNGRAPLWNRFVLAGNPLLGTGQAGVLHPATWLGIALPVPLSFTFSCTFTLFLALLSAFLFFRDFGLSERAALLGAVGWGFSTYVVFWVGWSVGPSTATFPLLLLGLRRLVHAPTRAAVGLTAAALWLSFCGGHPESFFHSVAAGGVYFLWELFPRRGPRARAIGGAVGAGLLALLLCGPQLFPLLEAIPHSAEYRERRQAVAKGAARQAVPLAEAARRLLPDALPFAHGIYGRSPVNAQRDQGSGMPLGYAGAVLFPLAVLAFAGGKPEERGRAIFLGFALAGLAYGVSAPGLLDVTERLPGFALALNYRLVFLAGLGLSGLAASGVQRLERRAVSPMRAIGTTWICVVLLLTVFLVFERDILSRGLAPGFLWRQLAFELGPLVLLAFAWSLPAARSRMASPALLLLIGQRFLEMRGTYPTLPAASLAPSLPTLAAMPLGSDPARIVAAGSTFRPNASALYRMEDVRGYESLVLDRFADTFPLWCREQHASFNRVDDLSRPFLSLLNVRWAVGAGDEAPPEGWNEQARGGDLAVFENPRALPRAFVPRTLRRQADARLRLQEMARAADFGQEAWLSEATAAPESNGAARVLVRGAGPDLVLSIEAQSRVFVATSLPDWPGWTAEENGAPLPLETVNHAFVGLWLPAGSHAVRLTYGPLSWLLGLGTFAAGALGAVLLATRKRRPS